MLLLLEIHGDATDVPKFGRQIWEGMVLRDSTTLVDVRWKLIEAAFT